MDMVDTCYIRALRKLGERVLDMRIKLVRLLLGGRGERPANRSVARGRLPDRTRLDYRRSSHRPRRKIGKALAGAALAAAAFAAGWLLFSPVPFDPVAWSPGENPAGTAPWLPNGGLAAARFVPTGQGPESIAVGPEGGIFTGLEDGRIVRYGSDGSSAAIADTGGRPLGLKFGPNGRLFVADAIRGLLTVHPSGEVSVLADSADGERLQVIEDLVVARDGTVWFTEGSRRFGYEDRLVDSWEARQTGRLLSWSPAARSVRVVLEGLAFANGVALSPDEDFILVSESDRYRIRRLWLKGPKSGTSEFFIRNLPGYPDGLAAAEDGYWVAFAAPRMPFVDLLAPYPFLRKAAYRLFHLLGPAPVAIANKDLIEPSIFYRVFIEGPATGSPSAGWIAKLDAGGNVVRSLSDPTGRVRKTSSVTEHSGTLYIGSYANSAIAVLPLSEERPATHSDPAGATAGGTGGNGAYGRSVPLAGPARRGATQ